ncbi:MAG: phenylacetate--CoA ligase family protein [Ammonifex sp.]|jgi:phenylacetate-CoA ligase|nr:MAG: phenylacetate--CoA ligase family protein [Ammonifex sp.]
MNLKQVLKQIGRPAPVEKYLCHTFPDIISPAGLAEYQKESLRAIIERAYEHSPFYREKMTRAGVTPGEVVGLDLGRLPFTTKDELRGKPWVLLACEREDVSLIQVSTGTTGGEEIYIMNTWEDYYLREMATGYPVLVPIEPGDICLNALPYEMSSAGLAFHKTFMDSCQATVIPAGKGGAYSTPAKTVKLMRELQPTVAITSPSWAVTLHEAAVERAFDVAGLPLKRMWLTGEGCSPAFRERVEKIWGTVANFYYGSLECGAIGIECDAHNGYHLAGAHVFVEIVDQESGEVLEPGEIGEIVVTCLLRYDTPLLRYRTQDLGFIEPDPCRCGVALPRLHLRGRLTEQVVIQGVSFSPFYLEEFLMRIPEVGNWFQFVVNPAGSDVLRIRAEPAAGVSPSAELADTLASKMEFATGLSCGFEFVAKLPRPHGKTVRVVHQ